MHSSRRLGALGRRLALHEDADLLRRGWEATQPTDEALTQAIAVQLLAGTLIALAVAGLAPPGDTNPAALATVATVAAAFGALLLAAPVTRSTVHTAIAVVSLLVTAAVTVTDPIGLSPLLYLWPLLLATHFVHPGRLVGQVVLAAAGFVFAIAAGAGSQTPVHDFAHVGVAATIGVIAMRRLRIRVAILHAEFTEHASRDPLTGVLNRTAFEQRLHDWLGDGLVRRQQLSLLLVDIDHFARVNETGSYPGGDLALQHVADLVRQTMRKTDSVGRVGGDAFAVLMPAAGSRDAVATAERIRKTVARRSEECGFRFTVSIGVAGSAVFGNPWSAATRALTLAKAAGRDRVVLAETETAVDGELSGEGTGLAAV